MQKKHIVNKEFLEQLKNASKQLEESNPSVNNTQLESYQTPVTAVATKKSKRLEVFSTLDLRQYMDNYLNAYQGQYVTPTTDGYLDEQARKYIEQYIKQYLVINYSDKNGTNPIFKALASKSDVEINTSVAYVENIKQELEEIDKSHIVLSQTEFNKYMLKLDFNEKIINEVFSYAIRKYIRHLDNHTLTLNTTYDYQELLKNQNEYTTEIKSVREDLRKLDINYDMHNNYNMSFGHNQNGSNARGSVKKCSVLSPNFNFDNSQLKTPTITIDDGGLNK